MMVLRWLTIFLMVLIIAIYVCSCAWWFFMVILNWLYWLVSIRNPDWSSRNFRDQFDAWAWRDFGLRRAPGSPTYRRCLLWGITAIIHSSLLWYQSIVEAPHAASSSSLTRCLFARQRERRTACRPYQVAVIVDICRFSTFKPSWWGEKMQVGPQELTVSLGKYGKMMIISWNFGYPIFRPCSPLSFVMIH
jgi:hypothetical protein